MTTLFGNLSNDGLEEAQDRLGGKHVFDADAYTGTIKAMYAGQSDKGAHNVTVVLDINGMEYKETVYITSQKGENFFINKNDKTKKVPLPGFTTIDDICLIATGEPLSKQETEDKVVNVYNKTEGKELPTSVPMLMDCLGKEVRLGIINTLENRNKSDGQGNYVPTEKEDNNNSIDKVFHPTALLTVAEARRDSALIEDGKEPLGAQFHDKWVERNKGKVRDKRTYNADSGTKSGRPGRAAAPDSSDKPQPKKLFG